MNQDPFAAIAEFYDRRVAKFGHDPRACDYGRASSQQHKFRVLAGVSGFAGRTVLDVGCGFADYAGFLQASHPGVKYTGIDLSPAMVAEARRLRPDLDLRTGNLLEMDAGEQFDVVSANGIFYLLGAEAPELMARLVGEMFRRCRVAVAFNSLSGWTDRPEPGEFYADPIETLAWCRRLTPWVVMRHDYLPHDFTVYLYRSQPGS